MRIDKKYTVQILGGLQWASCAAALATVILLLVQAHLYAPAPSGDFSRLTGMTGQNQPDQNLREEIRARDMLTRTTYFTSMRQARTGTIIFFAAAGLFLLLWNVRTTYFPAPPAPPGEKTSWWKRQRQSARTAAMASAAIALTAVLAGVNYKYQLTSSLFNKRDAAVDSETLARWWMNFRGPNGTGIAAFDNAPIKFDGTTMVGVRWKTETPLEGFSSPVVYADKIFLTGATKDLRQVFCFDANNGKLLWKQDVKITDQPAPAVDDEAGYAAPTAACDGNNVYAIFATGELAAFTLKGKPVWSRFMGTPSNHYGHSSSLIVHNGLLFVQLDEYDTGELAAIDTRNGKIVWTAERKILSWASPILINTGARQELILVDNAYVTSYDPATGIELWSEDCLYGEVGPSAAFAGGMVFTANEHAVAAGIDVVNTGENGKPVKRWQWRGDLPNTASPVAADTLLFLAASNGAVTCINANSGTAMWTHLFDKGFYSSPIISGGNVFLFDRGGVMHVFEAAAEFNLIESSAIGERVSTTPAILDGYIIVRGDKHLYRIDGI